MDPPADQDIRRHERAIGLTSRNHPGDTGSRT